MVSFIPITASPEARARDISIERSCNCRCFSFPFRRQRSLSLSTPMYINSDGVAVVFDPKKADDERAALIQAIANLQYLIAEAAANHQREIDEVHKEIEKRVGVKITPEEPAPLTLGLIQSINAAIKDIFKKE